MRFQLFRHEEMPQLPARDCLEERDISPRRWGEFLVFTKLL